MAELAGDISGCATSAYVAAAVSAKRDLLDLLYMVQPQSPDAFDKWVLAGPIEKYSKVVLDPYDDPDLDAEAGELAWGWWADEITDGRCAYLTWDGESTWTLLVRDGLLTYLSASTDGEWDDLSVSFTGENGEWVIDRAGEADMLALDRKVKKWVEDQNYLTNATLDEYALTSDTSALADRVSSIEQQLAGVDQTLDEIIG